MSSKSRLFSEPSETELEKWTLFGARPGGLREALTINELQTPEKIDINCKRFAQSAGLGSEKGSFLELFYTFGAPFGALFHDRGAVGSHFWLIFRSLGALWERRELTF